MKLRIQIRKSESYCWIQIVNTTFLKFFLSMTLNTSVTDPDPKDPFVFGLDLLVREYGCKIGTKIWDSGWVKNQVPDPG